MAKTKHFTNHPGWVTNLCTFALWQQLSVCTRQSAFLLNQSKRKMKSELLADLLALHKIRRKVETIHT
jgi:hypothetical protein